MKTLAETGGRAETLANASDRDFAQEMQPSRLKHEAGVFMVQHAELSHLRAEHSEEGARVSGKDIRIPPKYFMALDELMCRQTESDVVSMTNSQFMLHALSTARTVVFGEIDWRTSYDALLEGWDDQRGFMGEALVLLSKTKKLRLLTMEDRLKLLQGAVHLWSSELTPVEYRVLIGLLVRCLYCGETTIKTPASLLCAGNEFYAPIAGRTQFHDSVRSLVERGALSRQTFHARKPDQYTIHLDWYQPVTARFNGLNLTRDQMKNALKGLRRKGFYERTDTGKGAFVLRRQVENKLGFPGVLRSQTMISGSQAVTKVQNNSSIDQEWPMAASSPAASDAPHHEEASLEVEIPKEDFASEILETQDVEYEKLIADKVFSGIEGSTDEIASPAHELEGVPSSAVLEMRMKHDSRVSVVQLERRWHQTLRQVSDLFGPLPRSTFSPKQRAKIAARMKEYPRRSDVPFATLVEWSIINWRQVIRHRFAWANDTPEVPNIDWLMSAEVFFRFNEAFHAKSLGSLKENRFNDDETRVQELMSKGATRQEAIMLLAKEKATRAMRQEIAAFQEATTRKLNSARSLAARADEEDRLTLETFMAHIVQIEPRMAEMLTPKGLVHPNSPKASGYRKEVRFEQAALRRERSGETQSSALPKGIPRLKQWEEMVDDVTISSHGTRSSAQEHRITLEDVNRELFASIALPSLPASWDEMMTERATQGDYPTSAMRPRHEKE